MSVAERLEATWLDTFWVPPHVEVVDIGALKLLRSEADYPPYNMVLRLPAQDLDGAIAAVLEEHRGRRSRVLVFGERPEAEEALSRAGYEAAIHHHGWSVDTATFSPRPHPGVEAREVRTREELLAMLEVNDAAFGKHAERTDAEIDQFLRDSTRPDRRVVRVVAWQGERALSGGGVTLYPSLDLGLLWAGGTRPEARRRGAYSAVLAGRILAAGAAGIGTVGVYARDDTSGPVVAAQGFTRHERMVAWERDA